MKRKHVQREHLTARNYDKFCSLYDQACADNKDHFYFNGKRVLLDYARYLIQYVEIQQPFNTKGNDQQDRKP